MSSVVSILYIIGITLVLLIGLAVTLFGIVICVGVPALGIFALIWFLIMKKSFDELKAVFKKKDQTAEENETAENGNAENATAEDEIAANEAETDAEKENAEKNG